MENNIQEEIAEEKHILEFTSELEETVKEIRKYVFRGDNLDEIREYTGNKMKRIL